MAKFEGYKCDVCGAAKAAANHWYIGHVNGAGQVVLMAWSNDHFDMWSDLCGRACAQKYVEQWMGGAA